MKETHVKTVTDIHTERPFKAAPGEVRGEQKGAGECSSHVKLGA